MELRVGPIVYRVVEVPELKDEHGEALWGQMLQEEQEIQVRAGATPQRRDMTVLHELLHAISDEFGADLSEAQIRVIEVGLTHAAAGAPEFFRSWIANAAPAGKKRPKKRPGKRPKKRIGFAQ